MIPSGSEYTSITANENTVYSPVDMEGKDALSLYSGTDYLIHQYGAVPSLLRTKQIGTVLYSVTRACTLRYTHSDTKDAIAIIPHPTSRTVSPAERGRSTNYQYCTYVPFALRLPTMW